MSPSENSTNSTGMNVSAAPGVFLMTNNFETGGSERQFATLARALDPAAYRLCLGCIVSKGAFLEGLGDVPAFPLGGSLYGAKSLQTRLRLARHLRREKIAVAHAFDFYTNLTMIPAARLARVPVVIGSQRQIGDLLTPAQFRAQLASFRWCDVVVCNSRAAAAPLLEHGLPQSKIAVIGNGLPVSAFAQPEPALPRRPDLLRVGMVARMNAQYKNHSLFLRAATLVASRFPHVEFVLVGDGPLRSELEQQAEALGIRHRVQFLGERHDVDAVLASLDISVLPSASESLSNAILESMAAAVPVVATRVGGNPELINDETGILVEADAEAALAGGMERLLRDAGLRAMLGSKAREFARRRFSVESISRQYEELYCDWLERKTHHRVNPRSRPKISGRSGNDSANDRLRVTIIAPTLRYVGGQSVQADLLLRHWRDDPKIEARLLPVDPPLPFGLRWIERIPVLRTSVREPLYLWKLWRELRNTDIAHIFSASYYSFLLAPAPASWIARLRGKRTLLNYHSGEARDHLQRFPRARKTLANVDRLIVPSAYLVDVFREFDLEAQSVPNVVDLEQISFRPRGALRPHLVCTRGFHPYYCVDVVVRAFAEVQRQFRDARLDLVGGGPTESEIRALVQQLNLRNVNFAGVVSRAEIGRYYDEADIFINASRVDNMPLSILEAFAAGTPVVTTAPECMRYLVEHEQTGLLSETGDATALAENVIRLLRDPELSSRLARTAHEESRRFQWKSVRTQWLQVYESLAPRKIAQYSSAEDCGVLK